MKQSIKKQSEKERVSSEDVHPDVKAAALFFSSLKGPGEKTFYFTSKDNRTAAVPYGDGKNFEDNATQAIKDLQQEPQLNPVPDKEGATKKHFRKK